MQCFETHLSPSSSRVTDCLSDHFINLQLLGMLMFFYLTNKVNSLDFFNESNSLYSHISEQLLQHRFHSPLLLCLWRQSEAASRCQPAEWPCKWPHSHLKRKKELNAALRPFFYWFCLFHNFK